MTKPEGALYVDKLLALRHMPKGDRAIEALVDMFCRIAEDGDHGDRIVEAMLSGYSDWPGPAALRQAAEATHPGRDREQGRLASQMEQWQEAYRERLGGICPDCNNFGIVTDPATKRVRRCDCPEGRPKWVNPDGRPCPPDTPGAVHYNSDEWIEGFNRALAKGKGLPDWVATAAERKPPAMELMRVPAVCTACGARYEVEVREAGRYTYKCQCGVRFEFTVVAKGRAS